MRNWLRSVAKNFNTIIRPLGVQLLSTAARSHHELIAQRAARLARNEFLLINSITGSESPTRFERRWLAFLANNIRQEDLRSGDGQDLFALFCLQGEPPGFFVEFGAFDGLYASNTYFFERAGWDGLLIEPLQSAVTLCRENRNVEVVHGAVDPEYRGNATIELIQAGPQSSDRVEAPGGDSTGRKQQSLEYERRHRAQERGHVEECPLLDLHRLLETRTDHVDFMTIDVEGHEAAIVEGFDFARFPVKVLCVEHNWRPRDIARLDAAMERHDYRHVLSYVSGRDAWFVRSDIYSQLNAP